MGNVFSSLRPICVEGPSFFSFISLVFLIDLIYEIRNGFCGMGRDVILRLCKLFWSDLRKIRNVSFFFSIFYLFQVIGIDRNFLFWRKHPYFVEGRPLS
jgi:hypothetical protein